QFVHYLDALGYLEAGQPVAGEVAELVDVDLLALEQGDIGDGDFAPPLVGRGDDGRLRNGGMCAEHLLDFYSRDVLSAGDDNVLKAIAQLQIPVRVHHREVTGVEPATGEGFSGRLRVTVVPEHDVVPAHDDLAERRAVGGHVAHHLVDHPDLLGDDGRHPLPGLTHGLVFIGKRIPVGIPGADGDRPIGLGQ